MEPGLHIQLTIQEWIKWMLERPARARRRQKLAAALDLAIPHWERLIAQPAFETWARLENPHTGKTRLDVIKSVSFDNLDDQSTARWLKIAQQEMTELSATADTGKNPLIDHRYEVLAQLGKGGHGAVLLVYSHEVEEFFALKQIHRELLSEPTVRERFIQEANVWVDLGKHNNIVAAEFVDHLGEETAILMELVDPDQFGRVSMQDYISTFNNELSQQQIADWAVGICQGMIHAVSNHVRAHRDLKPDNILIVNGSVAKITDFGISSLRDNALVGNRDYSNAKNQDSLVKTRENAILGTLPYMPPEQFLDASNCDEHSDIYSFGVILYQLISQGRWPYGDLSSLLKKVDSGSLPQRFYEIHAQGSPISVSSPYYDIVLKCLQKSPRDRPKSFREVEQLLREVRDVSITDSEEENATPYFDPWETGRKAASLLRLGRYEEALALFDEILDKFPIGLQWEFDKALTLSKLNREDEALSLYTKIIAREPSHLGALVNKGLLCKKRGYVKEAKALFLTALAHDPKQREALTNMGNLFYDQGNLKQALRYYKKILEVEPKDPTAWYNMALAYQGASVRKKSCICFRNFLKCSDPTDSRRKYALKSLNAANGDD